MKKKLALFFILIFLFIYSFPATKGITPEVLKILKNSIKTNPTTNSKINSITQNSINSLSKNKMVTDKLFDRNFTIVLKNRGVTNQKRSGRCWLFAGLNILRFKTAQKYNLEKFELSQNYNFFYDKLEKANLFLEKIIETRKEDINSREVVFLLKNPIPDGGQWNMVVELVKKYGVVPKEVMPETYHSSNTKELNRLLSTYLRKCAVNLRETKASIKKLRKMKIEMLKKVYKILVYTLGNPPEKFSWRYKDKDGKLSSWKEYTPHSFYDEFIGEELSNYVMLYNYPAKPYYKLYSISLDRDMADKKDMTFLNLPIDELKKLALKTIRELKEPVWFGCDVGKELLGKDGIMAKGVYDHESLFGVDFSMTKRERVLYRHSIPTHAMVFLGVDLDKNGKPVKWLVENSWGEKAGKNGLYVMYDKWFDDYLYEIVVPLKVLNEEQKKLLKQKPVKLPPWDPMYEFFVYSD